MTTPLTFDGFDDAIIGLASRPGQPELVAYDYEKMVQVLVDRDGMTMDDAVEYLEFNTICAYVGPGTPLVVRVMNREEIDDEVAYREAVDEEPEPGVP